MSYACKAWGQDWGGWDSSADVSGSSHRTKGHIISIWGGSHNSELWKCRHHNSYGFPAGIIDRALEAQQQEEEEEFLESQFLLYKDNVPVRTQHLQKKHEEEEEYGCYGIAMEVEKDIAQDARGGFYPSRVLGVACGWWAAICPSELEKLCCWY